MTPACVHEQRPTGEVGLPDRPTDRPGYVRLAGTIPNSHAERRFVRWFSSVQICRSPQISLFALQETAEGRRDDARGAVLMARHTGATPQLAAREETNRRWDNRSRRPSRSEPSDVASDSDRRRPTDSRDEAGSQETAEGRRDDARGAILMARRAGATQQQTPRQTDRGARVEAK